MPGTKTSGRPGGNPEIATYGFKTDREEPLTERIQLRVSESMKQALARLDCDRNEFIRNAIAQALLGLESKVESSNDSFTMTN